MVEHAFDDRVGRFRTLYIKSISLSQKPCSIGHGCSPACQTLGWPSGRLGCLAKDTIRRGMAIDEGFYVNQHFFPHIDAALLRS